MRTYFPENDTQRPALPDSSESDYAYYGSEEERVQLLDYWKNLVKRRRIIIQIFIIFLLVGAYFTFTATPVYKATATLKIEPINPMVTGVTGVGEAGTRIAEGGGPYDYYQTQYKLLASSALAARVIADLRLDSNKIFTSASITSDNPVARVRSWILGTLDSFISPVEKFFKESRQDPAESDTPDAAPRGGNIVNRQETDKN